MSEHEPQPDTTHPRRSRKTSWTIAIVILALVVFCVWMLRRRDAVARPTETPERTVAVATVERQDLYNEVTIPAEFRPYVEAELNAKVSGYLKTITVDFGDVVKSNQLLAVLEVPELKAELDASIAAEHRAEADYTNAHLIYTRLVDVNKEHPNLVAEQDIDTARAKDSMNQAAVASAKADVEKYQTLFGYTQITAPFDGVVTWRSADPGALIQAGTSSGQARALVRVADNYLLRLDFPVSVKYVKDVELGATVTVRVESLGNETFEAKVTRFTQQVDDATRTMTTEIEVKNPDLKIKPGMYASVVLEVEHHSNVLAIPTEAVASARRSTVDVVNSDNQIEERVVTLGLETPNRYEVTGGLKEGEKVVIGNQSQLHAGDKVATKPWPGAQTNWAIPKGEQ